MKAICVISIVICLIAKSSSENLQQPSKLKSIPTVDALILRLEVEEWAGEEACRQASLRILNGVRNNTLWATWMWDSMQPPLGVFYGSGYSFGNYDQCLNAPWLSQKELSPQYCLVEVKIQEPMEHRVFHSYDSADDYLNTFSSFGRTLNHIRVGLCMPAVCSPSSIARFYRHMLQLTYIPNADLVTVDPKNCQTAEQGPFPDTFLAFLFGSGALLSIVVVSTVYLYINNNKGSSRIDKIAKSFCMINNWNDLFIVNKNEIRALNGMRFLSSILVIFSHHCLCCLFKPSLLIDSLQLDEMLSTKIGQGLLHIDLTVDTFFAISGLLLAKGLLSGSQKNLLVVLIKRYIRLTGPYIVTTFYIMYVARHTGSGPFWPKANSVEEDICEKYAWKNVFMLNYDMQTMCFGVAWYVNCEYHLAILTIMLFWIYRRNRKGGIIAFFTVGCFLTVQLAVMAYRKRIQVVPYINLNVIGNIQDIYEKMNDAYIRWHDRAGSYLVGIAMGWIMAKYKPAEHRNYFGKITSSIIALVSLFVMMSLITICMWFSATGRVELALIVATNRMVWAAAVCALIAACEYGSVPIINDVLGCAFFVPLSKLSYGIYMVHFLVLQRNMHTTRSPLNIDYFNMVLAVSGTTVIATIAGLVLYILVEAPCINISKLYLIERNDKAALNSTKEVNGVHQNGKEKFK